MINQNGNNLANTSVIINHNNTGSLPAGVRSAAGYYQKSNPSNSLRISNRLVSIPDAGNYPINEGLIVRVYYSISEYTNIVTNSTPVGEIIDDGWFRSDLHTAAAVVANMSTGAYALPTAEKIIPINSGSENGIALVEFRLIKMGTIGLYAKTTEGSLGPLLSVKDTNLKGKLVIAPNPVNATINIQKSLNQIQIEKTTIINLLGQILCTHSRNELSTDIEILTPSTYIIILETSEARWSDKFITQ